MQLTELDDVTDLLVIAFVAMSLLLATLVAIERWLTRPRPERDQRSD